MSTETVEGYKSWQQNHFVILGFALRGNDRAMFWWRRRGEEEREEEGSGRVSQRDYTGEDGWGMEVCNWLPGED